MFKNKRRFSHWFITKNRNRVRFKSHFYQSFPFFFLNFWILNSFKTCCKSEGFSGQSEWSVAVMSQTPCWQDMHQEQISCHSRLVLLTSVCQKKTQWDFSHKSDMHFKSNADCKKIILKFVKSTKMNIRPDPDCRCLLPVCPSYC